MTRQKTQSTAKQRVAKKAPAKNTNVKSRSASVSKRVSRSDDGMSSMKFFSVSIGIFVMAVSVVVVMALLTSDYIIGKGSETREARINDIYASLNLDDTYNFSDKAIFGEKRVYSWDSGRTESSSMEFLRGDTVSNTVADADARIKAAGFSFIDEPYQGSPEVQYHYRSAAGEYIRLTVTSKIYRDSLENARIMNSDQITATSSIDKNSGPSHVLIKVNLDDNNE